MSLNYLEKTIEPYKPLKDINTIVVETNRIFHTFEAKEYDNNHPEIFMQLPPIYEEMCKLLPHDKSLKVLNFGCGTGFEASQLLRNVQNNAQNIETLYCYDLSKEMLDICRQKLKNAAQNIMFVSDLSEIPPDIKFDVLATNSLLHHLPKPFETVAELTKFMAEDCFYFMGHEDSARFYRNRELLNAINAGGSGVDSGDSSLSLNLKRISNIKKYPHYVKRLLGIAGNPYSLTAEKLVETGLFALKPDNNTINLIIDCCVPHDVSMAEEGVGFDFRTMSLHEDWELLYHKTYNFLNTETPMQKLGAADKRKYKMLEEKYPDDGLNFCCVWKRKQKEMK